MEAHWFRERLELLHNTILVGIDPGTRSTGLACFWAVGGRTLGYTKQLRAADDIHWPRRVCQIYDLYVGELASRLDAIPWQILQPRTTVLGIEMPAVYPHQGSTSVKIGYVGGAILAATRDLARYHIYTYLVPPKMAKATLAGDGSASLGQMMEAARQWWRPETNGVGDEAIALGVALAAWKLYKEREINDGK